MGEWSPIERMHFECAHAFFILNQERYVFRFTNVRNSRVETSYAVTPHQQKQSMIKHAHLQVGFAHIASYCVDFATMNYVKEQVESLYVFVG